MSDRHEPKQVDIVDARGLYDKYRVERVDGRDGEGDRHFDCEYFVLDLTHDAAAIPAIVAYADAVAATQPYLRRDLLNKAYRLLLAGGSCELTVTHLDVSTAEARPWSNPIARCMNRRFPSSNCVVVEDRASIHHGGAQALQVSIGEEAADWLRRWYDKCSGPSHKPLDAPKYPFTFSIAPVEEQP
jgi:hypothetical protein